MGEGDYKVSFSLNGRKLMATFNSTGAFLSKCREINSSELPASISNLVRTNYSDRIISEVLTVVDNNGITGYIIKLRGSPEIEIMCDANGHLVKEK